MINANATPTPNGCYVLEFFGPEGVRIKSKPITVSGLSEAKRVVYFKNRKYIFSKLLSFIHQRKYVFLISNSPSGMNQAFLLEHFLVKFERSSFYTLCKVVSHQRKRIELIAPVESSQQYKYYQNVIQPILNYCESIIAEGE